MRATITTIMLLLFIAALVITNCSESNHDTDESMPRTVSYSFHIRPILSDKCFKCHGPDDKKREANLRLDIADSAYAPLTETKGAYAIVPGKPMESELYKRVSSQDSSFMMPPPAAHLGMLTSFEVALVKQWITEGARYEKHWAFIAPQQLPLPKPKDKDWARNEIDYFILDKLSTKGLVPNEEADKERLLKRVSLDITGLPPSIAFMDAFLADASANAYEKAVDSLLSSPQYGEKMAIHWLDVARYADSYGYQDDNLRTQWPWRDWVISAFNRNIPYNQFITWQIAGDMLPGATKEQRLATAFFRNHKYTEEGGVIHEEYRVEYLLDKVKTYGKGIQGLTIECAQCHDHKYDPFSQTDYYSLLAFFNNTKEKGFESDAVYGSYPAKHPLLNISPGEIQQSLSFIHQPDTGSLMVSVLAEDTARKTFVLQRGAYDQPGAEVQAAAIPAVMPFPTSFPRNRLGLAQWTVDRKNPLTARVFVNQVWQEIFGKGLVKTSGDFGMQGELPSHPALLDWLAVDFMEHGWDIKRLVKQFVMSATYRQSARVTKDKLSKDPENIFLSRGPRNRLSAELVRDMVLSSSGLLQRRIGGPSARPYQPKGLWEGATSGRGLLTRYIQDKDGNQYRRGMYTFIKLTIPPPGMILFDASNRDQCEVKRSQTNTPLQALIMMNDPVVLEAARVFAQRLSTGKASPEEQVKLAFRSILCRQPAEKELLLLSNYYREQLQQFNTHQLDATRTLQVGDYPQLKTKDINALAALMKTICAIYNLEEAITKT